MRAQESQWQSEARRCAVVLREVFAWLAARELARAGAACRAWRRAAAEPRLWRRLLQRAAPPAGRHPHRPPDAAAEVVSWRQEYVTAMAGWALEARLAAAGGGAVVLHAALSPAHDTLALGADDASLAVWRCERGSWRELWRLELRPRGWSAVARVQWASTAPRLLLAGPRALVDDWELMVLRLDDDFGDGIVASRIRCSAGAAGCWADAAGDAFLSLELRLVGPGLACTVVRLNAATQETQSEYAGVTTTLLRIFNEDRAHITHALVAAPGDDAGRVLVAGSARGLAAWPVLQPRPPPLLVGAPGELAERVRRARARAAAPAPELDEAAPDEAAVRGACAPPDRECRLPAPLVGLALHDSGRWLWAMCGDGSATCVCARSLEPRCVLRAPGAGGGAGGAGGGGAPVLHYVQPAVSDQFFVSPEGAYSPRVWSWALSSGAAAPCGGAAGRGGGAAGRGGGAGGAAVCSLLPRAEPAAVLVFAGDSLYVWRHRATSQSPPAGLAE